MKVFKSINNNIVSAIDENGREIVVIGKGIGYKARKGDEVPVEKIEKTFLMNNQQNIERLSDLHTLPTECIELAEQILKYTKQHIKESINEGVCLILADHISFAITRFRSGMEFQNILLPEVRRFYPKEFATGMYALGLIKDKFDIDMPEDEAASIAFYIVNAKYDISVMDVFKSTRLLEQIADTIKEEMGFELQNNNYYCERFFGHLRHLAQRIIQQEVLSGQESGDFLEMLQEKYPKEVKCAKAVADAVWESRQHKLSKEEISSLALHIRRIGLNAID